MEEKKNSLDLVLEKINGLSIPFSFVKKIKNSMNGLETETVLLEYEGSQFVYVEGKENVTLGWDAEQCPVGEGVLLALKKYHEEDRQYYEEQEQDLIEYYQDSMKQAWEKGDFEKMKQYKEELKEELESLEGDLYPCFEEFLEEWNTHLKTCLSPLRQCSIGSMLVEADSQYLCRDMTYEEVLEELKQTPFSLPTEDEWEYLVNGGTRTLFRWGDSLESEMQEMFRVGCAGDSEAEFTILDSPNMFGLYICYDSYKYELVENSDYLKGGDGGSSLCGGEDLIYIAPCYSAFYRSCRKKEKILSSHYYSYRRILRLT